MKIKRSFDGKLWPERGYSKIQDLFLDIYENPDCNCSEVHCSHCQLILEYCNELVKAVIQYDKFIERTEKLEKLFEVAVEFIDSTSLEETTENDYKYKILKDFKYFMENYK